MTDVLTPNPGPARSAISKTQVKFSSSLEFPDTEIFTGGYNDHDPVYVGNASAEIDQVWDDLILREFLAASLFMAYTDDLKLQIFMFLVWKQSPLVESCIAVRKVVAIKLSPSCHLCLRKKPKLTHAVGRLEVFHSLHCLVRSKLSHHEYLPYLSNSSKNRSTRL